MDLDQVYVNLDTTTQVKTAKPGRAKAQQALHAAKGAAPTRAQKARTRSRRDPEALTAAKTASVPPTGGPVRVGRPPARFRS